MTQGRGHRHPHSAPTHAPPHRRTPAPSTLQYTNKEGGEEEASCIRNSQVAELPRNSEHRPVYVQLFSARLSCYCRFKCLLARYLFSYFLALWSLNTSLSPLSPLSQENNTSPPPLSQEFLRFENVIWVGKPVYSHPPPPPHWELMWHDKVWPWKEKYESAKQNKTHMARVDTESATHGY